MIARDRDAEPNGEGEHVGLALIDVRIDRIIDGALDQTRIFDAIDAAEPIDLLDLGLTNRFERYPPWLGLSGQDTPASSYSAR